MLPTDPNYFMSLSIFSNMESLITPPSGFWPVSLVLPDLSSEKPKEQEKLPNIFSNDIKNKSKKVTACPHSNRKHYAKNMCNNCYHRQGRDKNAWECEHHERKNYAKGKCQYCYLKGYNFERREVDKQDNTE